MPDGRNENRKSKRRIEYLEQSIHFFIFCEGERTEPNYFEGFKKLINKNPIYKDTVTIEVQPVGAGTVTVINTAIKYVNDNYIKNSEIWCVYDKDSFPARDFNSVSAEAKRQNQNQHDVSYNVAWSNQCIEYWFILHFDCYESDNDRKFYSTYLNKKFSENGYGKYEKNNKELFDILTYKGNPKQAIKRANARLEDCSGKTDANSVPATKIHLLVMELAKYLPDDVKGYYI